MKKSCCPCKGPHTKDPEKDFARLTDYYSCNFTPSGWELEYTSINHKDTERFLFLTGRCQRCGELMRSGVSVGTAVTGDALFAHIYERMNQYRPYANKEPSGLYRGCVPQRSEWYWDQDHLPAPQRIRQFVALFHEKDREAAHAWTKVHIVASTIQRDTSSELFHAVLETALNSAAGKEAKTFLTWISSKSGRYPHCTFLTDYRFVFWPELNFGGQEGLYIDCVLYGTFDQSGRDKLSIGSIRCGRTDLDACQAMGALTGALLYASRVYLKENHYRYLPDCERSAIVSGKNQEGGKTE